MANYPDTIRGSFTRETFALHRTQSVCSVHRKNSIKKSEINKDQKSINVIGCGQQPQERARINQSFHHFRFLVAFISGLAVGFMTLLRLNITVAILNMVNQTQIYLEEHDHADLAAYFGENYEEVGEFDWDNEMQQQIIVSYMIAYTLPQLLTTKLAIKIGTKWSIPISLSLCALSCLLTPILAYQGWQYVMILRLLNGLGAAPIIPMMVYIIEIWLPARERVFGLAIAQFNQSLLFTLSPLISGILAETHWKWTFYVPAALAILFCLLWLCLMSDGPNDCSLISQKELDFLCRCHIVRCPVGGDRQLGPQTDNCTSKETQPAPSDQFSWTKALKFRSFYALAFVWIAYNCSFSALSFLLPIYMRQVLKVTIMENGMLCFVIQCGCTMSVIWPQPLLRFFQNTLKLSLTASRRFIYTLSKYTRSEMNRCTRTISWATNQERALYDTVRNNPHDFAYTVTLIAMSTLLLVARYHQYQVVLLAINRIFHLSMDTIVTGTIMSQYSKAGISSVVFSVINSIGNLATVFFCMVVGEFLDISGQSIECWSYVFVAMCCMSACSLITFSTLITSEPIEFERTENSEVEVGAKSTKSYCPDNCSKP